MRHERSILHRLGSLGDDQLFRWNILNDDVAVFVRLANNNVEELDRHHLTIRALHLLLHNFLSNNLPRLVRHQQDKFSLREVLIHLLDNVDLLVPIALYRASLLK